MRLVTGVIRHYDWGDSTTLPGLLGRAGDGQPWAEVWFGTHPDAPATLDDGTPLADVSGPLPFLLKLLCADRPLSLQAHPGRERAEEAFAGGHPCYRDPFAKPELLCALTPFHALCGVRPIDATCRVLEGIGADQLRHQLEAEGVRALVEGLLAGDIDPEPAVEACRISAEPEADVVTDLWRRYPGDPAAVVSLVLNHVTLRPGQAIFLGAGNLHAYLHGTGVEVMGASDNVLRAGLTSKPVDVAELMAVMSTEPLADPVLSPIAAPDGSITYDTDAPFRLTRWELDGAASLTTDGPELLLCTKGDSGLARQGEVAYVRAGETVELTGPATLFEVAGASG